MAFSDQASFWKNFQEFFSKANLADKQTQPPPVTTPQNQVQEGLNFMQSGNQQMPNFLSQLQQLKPTPMPQQQQIAPLRNNTGQLPPGSYASQIRGLVQSYK